MSDVLSQNSDPVSGTSRPVSLLSLDHFKGVERLSPGVPKELSPGVTLSILQTAAEGLLEVDSSQELGAEVNGKRALELATVQVGQVIKTSKGRFIMVRHLEAIIVPRTSDEKRPEYIVSAIALARAAIAERSNSGIKEDNSESLKPIKSVQENFFNRLPSGSSKKFIVRALIVACLFLIGLMLWRLPSDEAEPKVGGEESSKQQANRAKSTIVAIDSSREESLKTSQPGESKVNESSVNPSTRSTQASSERAPAKKIHVTSASLKIPHGQVNRESGKASSESRGSSGVSSVRLSEKDRQTVVEYKLEARFDRSSARAKLKHLAQSFPAGSPARAEVERAYSDL